MKYRVAVASTDGKVVNQHFGKADIFYIFEVDTEKAESFELTEIRQTDAVCEGGEHSEKRLEEAIQRIKDCAYVLVSRIGYRAENALTAVGIQAFELPGIISESLDELLKFIEIQAMIREFSGGKSKEVV